MEMSSGKKYSSICYLTSSTPTRCRRCANRPWLGWAVCWTKATRKDLNMPFWTRSPSSTRNSSPSISSSVDIKLTSFTILSYGLAHRLNAEQARILPEIVHLGHKDPCEQSYHHHQRQQYYYNQEGYHFDFERGLPSTSWIGNHEKCHAWGWEETCNCPYSSNNDHSDNDQEHHEGE